MTTGVFRGTVQAAQGPTWYQGLASGKWAAIAPSGPAAVWPNWGSVGSGPGFIGVQSPAGVDVINGWTGGCVNQAFKELLFVANGGHNGYYGNEVYSLRLDQSAPAWKLLAHPTPTGSLILDSTAIPSVNADGRCVSLHNGGQLQFANGRAWMTACTSTAGPISRSSAGVMSWNRGFVGVPQNTTDPALEWANNAGPWATIGAHAISSGTANSEIEFAPSCVDPSPGGLIWQFGNNFSPASSINPTTGAITTRAFTPPSGYYSRGMWAVGTDQGYAVIGWRDRKDVLRWHFTNHTMTPVTTSAPAGINFGFRATSGSGGVLMQPDGMGAAYHPNSRTIYVGDPFLHGGKIFKLDLNTTQWAWSEITNTGPVVPTSTAAAGIFSKWNYVDMGNNEGVIVSAGQWSGSTFVLKIPAGGL